MIKIRATFDKGVWTPERELTPEELKTVTSKLSNGATNEITFYQGDEPTKEAPIDRHPLVELILSRTLTSEEKQFIKQTLEISSK